VFSSSAYARDTAALHLSMLLFFPFLMFLIRDVWPLAYAHRDSPVHQHKTGGWLPMTQLTLIGVNGFLIPGFRPTPFRPSKPTTDEYEEIPNPVQTASPFSFLVFAFLDPLIIYARKHPHLPVEALPVVLPSDLCENLIEQDGHVRPLTSTVSGYF
jgi:hypothetical protein